LVVERSGGLRWGQLKVPLQAVGRGLLLISLTTTRREQHGREAGDKLPCHVSSLN
jgi:hypothetical protein